MRVMRRIMPYGVFAATVCLLNIVEAHGSYESLLYDKERFSEVVPDRAHFILFFAPW